MVRSYEMMVIIDSSIEDHSVEVKAIEEVVTNHGGEITKTDVWGKRRFAYEIAKKTEGIYVVFEYKAEPDQLKEIARLLSLRPMVVRQLTVSLDEE